MQFTAKNQTSLTKSMDICISLCDNGSGVCSPGSLCSPTVSSDPASCPPWALPRRNRACPGAGAPGAPAASSSRGLTPHIGGACRTGRRKSALWTPLTSTFLVIALAIFPENTATFPWIYKNASPLLSWNFSEQFLSKRERKTQGARFSW